MVTAMEDDIYEVDSQTFTLNLVLVNPTSSDIVLTDPSTATITIMDDEGIYELQRFLQLILFCCRGNSRVHNLNGSKFRSCHCSDRRAIC